MYLKPKYKVVIVFVLCIAKPIVDVHYLQETTLMIHTPLTLTKEAGTEAGGGEKGRGKEKGGAEAAQRTVTTLMGGRGYIQVGFILVTHHCTGLQWRATHLERGARAQHLAQINNSDACLVIWDHKL